MVAGTPLLFSVVAGAVIILSGAVGALFLLLSFLVFTGSVGLVDSFGFSSVGCCPGR